MEELKSALRNNKIEIKFTKIDGTKRTMIATLDSTKFTYIGSGKKSLKPKNDEIISVWDLEKNDWRSIKKNSIISWKILE